MKKAGRTKKNSRGVSLVEVLVGVAIILIALTSSMATFNYYIRAWTNNIKNIQASYLAEEGIEVLYYLRDGGWTANIQPLDNNMRYYLNWNGSNWTLSTNNTFIDGEFDRSFILYPVFRNASGNIAESGASDTGTRKVTVRVDWRTNNATSTKSITTYLSDIIGN